MTMDNEEIENEEVSFNIVLSSVWHDDPPIYEILLDDEVIDKNALSEKMSEDQEKSIKFTKKLKEGNYTIKIRLMGKEWKHTKLDENGNILLDQLLHIKQIEIDDIELDHLFYKLSNFHKQYGTKKGIPVYSETPEIEKYTTIGYNGEYRLQFSVPTYMWFLENL